MPGVGTSFLARRWLELLHLTTELLKNLWLLIWVEIFSTSWNFGYVSQDVLKTYALKEIAYAGKSKVKDHCPKRRSSIYPPGSSTVGDIKWWEKVFDPLLLRVILHPHPSDIVERIVAAVCVIRFIFMSYHIKYIYCLSCRSIYPFIYPIIFPF